MAYLIYPIIVSCIGFVLILPTVVIVIAMSILITHFIRLRFLHHWNPAFLAIAYFYQNLNINIRITPTRNIYDIILLNKLIYTMLGSYKRYWEPSLPEVIGLSIPAGAVATFVTQPLGKQHNNV